MAIIPKEKRRYVERRYAPIVLRKLFNIPDNEMVLDLVWNKTDNVIIVKTLLDYDKKCGDI